MSGAERSFVHPDEALAIVLEGAPAPVLERVPLAEALGRIAPAGMRALVDQPPFDKSAMDGFAHAGGPGPWRVVGTVAAGQSGHRALAAGECVRIMTGAPVPAGALGVQRVEWSLESEAEDGSVLVAPARPEPLDNVIRRGENQRAGDLLLGPRVLRAQDVGLLASSGYAEAEVASRPLVGILSTGDELTEAGRPLAGGAIYDSNGPLLEAQVQASGALARRYGIVRDEPAAIGEAIARALEECDVVLVSGGVSMGDFDHVPAALAASGVAPLFHGLAMKPGKPTFFGLRGRKAAFGMPGNPMSTFVNFEVLVRPHLRRRMGLDYAPAVVEARLGSALTRRETDRVEFLPARLERAGGARPGTGDGALHEDAGGRWVARPLAYHGSSMLSVLSEADCLLRMEIGVRAWEEGRTVDARLIRA